MRKIALSSLLLVVANNCGVSFAQVNDFQSAPFGVPMACRVIDGSMVCASRHNPATSAPPDKPCDASSLGSLLASIEYTTSSIRFCVTDVCANGLRTTDRIPYTEESYRVLYYVCGEKGWDLRCTTKTDISSKCARAASQVSCKDCDGKSTTFTPTTLSSPTRTQSSSPELGCREVLATYRPQVEAERGREQLAYETILAQSAISRSVVAHSAALEQSSRSCLKTEPSAPDPVF
ncbi:MAG: hypothetical protein RL326_1859 [Pseudomonadota bacterium]|jgi:hypothetical protein